jgi:hypothetical protein
VRFIGEMARRRVVHPWHGPTFVTRPVGTARTPRRAVTTRASVNRLFSVDGLRPTLRCDTVGQPSSSVIPALALVERSGKRAGPDYSRRSGGTQLTESPDNARRINAADGPADVGRRRERLLLAQREHSTIYDGGLDHAATDAATCDAIRERCRHSSDFAWRGTLRTILSEARPSDLDHARRAHLVGLGTLSGTISRVDTRQGDIWAAPRTDA